MPAKRAKPTSRGSKKTTKEAKKKAPVKKTTNKKAAVSQTKARPSVSKPTKKSGSSTFKDGRKIWFLNVDYDDRNTAKWGGAKWDPEERKWFYKGDTLPPALKPYASLPYSPERWFEDDLNLSNNVPTSLAHSNQGVSLREHQIEAAKAISTAYKNNSCGFLLADDVGLGKTYSAIEGILRMGQKLKILVLAPLSVVPHWRRSIATYGDGGNRWCVTNYDRTKKLLDIPQEAETAVKRRTKNKRIASKGRSIVDWDVIVCDEAHRLKNPTSQRSASVRNLINAHGEPAFVLWMSATAGQNPLELSYLAPLLAQKTGQKVKDLSDFEIWCKEYGLSITRGSFGQWGWVRNDEDLTKMRKLLFEGERTGLRRRPQDLANWPEVVRVATPAALESKEMRLYEKAWEEFCEELLLAKSSKNPTNPMVAALRFRQKASLLRIEHTANFAKESLENGLQVAISTQFLDAAKGLNELLEDSVVISGENTSQQREDLRVRFQQGDSQVAIFTITEGISLHAGEKAVKGNSLERALLIHDLRWSALDMAQIEGRCHRDGQRAVVYYMYGEETVEEKVASAVIHKLSDMANMLGGDLVGLEKLLREGGWEE